MRIIAALALVLLPVTSGAVLAQPGDVTVYRCVDTKGHVTLGNEPCATGSKEEVRTMQRPQDAPPRPVPLVEAPPPQPSVQTEKQVLVMVAPQPMYECVRLDGSTYTSDDAEGNPRWVPFWTQGYGGRRADASRGNTRPANSIWHNVGKPSPSRPVVEAGGQRPPVRGYAQGGTWVRDTCHALPQAEVCSRLADRREVIRRRFFNAQETERNELRREERGINARLAADCG